jgi:flagellar hook protein FlgE
VSGLVANSSALAAISDNIANVNTTAYKRNQVNFANMVTSQSVAGRYSAGGVQGITRQFVSQQGLIQSSASSTDLAIAGDGFFTIRNGATGDTLYTRNGAFTIDEAGYVNDGSNNRLQIFAPATPPATIDPSTATPIDALVPATNTATPPAAFAGLTIGEDGTVVASYADGTNTTIGVVALANFISPGGLRQVGSSNWKTTGISGNPEYGLPSEGNYGSIKSGALERSNVDIAEELVGLITAQRYFQANA